MPSAEPDRSKRRCASCPPRGVSGQGARALPLADLEIVPEIPRLITLSMPRLAVRQPLTLALASNRRRLLARGSRWLVVSIRTTARSDGDAGSDRPSKRSGWAGRRQSKRVPAARNDALCSALHVPTGLPHVAPNRVTGEDFPAPYARTTPARQVQPRAQRVLRCSAVSVWSDATFARAAAAGIEPLASIVGPARLSQEQL